jgi:hypothetical protein
MGPFKSTLAKRCAVWDTRRKAKPYIARQSNSRTPSLALGTISENSPLRGKNLRKSPRLSKSNRAIARDCTHRFPSGSLRNIGNVGDVMETFRTAISLDPELTSADMKLGNFLGIASDLSGLVAAHRASLALALDIWEVRYNLARTGRGWRYGETPETCARSHAAGQRCVLGREHAPEIGVTLRSARDDL